MADTVTIPLKKPIQGPNGVTIPNVVIREPTFNDVIELGDPYVLALTQEHGLLRTENQPAVKAYLQL